MILFEHELLRVGETSGSEVFTQQQFEAIARWKDRTNHPGIELGHRSLKATQWVGVLQIGRMNLEILPKAESDRDNQDRTDLVKKWKGILLGMLSCLEGFDLRSDDKASLRLQDRTLLEVFFHAFLTRTEAILREGLVKTYRQVAANRTAWRGRLLVSEDLKRNLVHRERVFTAAMEFDVHNPWNRILVAALRVLSRLFWKSEEGERQTVRPDLVLEPSGAADEVLELFGGSFTISEKTVLDTKWKVLKSAVPSDADLKQMFVYNELWAVRRSLLLYPKVHLTESVSGTFRAEDKGRESGCGLAFVPIVVPKRACVS